MADEASKSQTTDPNAAKENAVQQTDTTNNATGTTVQKDGDDMSQPPRTTNAQRDAADDAAAAERVAATTKDVVPSEYREKYAANNGTCGDFIATELSAMAKDGGVASLNAVKTENDLPASKWSELNNGMQRMNLANTLRARYLRGEAIKIGGKEHSIAKALIEFEGEGEDREPLKFDDAKELGKFIRMVDLQDNERTRSALVKAMSPKPEKKVGKTAEQKAAEKAERDKAKAEAAAAKTAEREKAKSERDAAAAKKKQEADDAKKAKEAERAKAKSERDAAKAKAAEAKQAAVAAKASEGGKAADDGKKAAQTAASNKAAANKDAGAVK